MGAISGRYRVINWLFIIPFRVIKVIWLFCYYFCQRNRTTIGMQKITHKIIGIGLLATVYAAFFVVQIFFNFEIISKAKASSQYHHVITARHIPASIHANATHPAKKSAFRLNKRFQPQVAPACVFLVPCVPVAYVLAAGPLRYKRPFLPAVIATNRLLRGPPVAA
jgi:hypothetical protein